MYAHSARAYTYLRTEVSSQQFSQIHAADAGPRSVVERTSALCTGSKQHCARLSLGVFRLCGPSSQACFAIHDTNCCVMQIAELGHGTFGIVIKAWDMRTQPPTEVAIKMLPRGDFVGAQVLSSHRI